MMFVLSFSIFYFCHGEGDDLSEDSSHLASSTCYAQSCRTSSHWPCQAPWRRQTATRSHHRQQGPARCSRCECWRRGWRWHQTAGPATVWRPRRKAASPRWASRQPWRRRGPAAWSTAGSSCQASCPWVSAPPSSPWGPRCGTSWTIPVTRQEEKKRTRND